MKRAAPFLALLCFAGAALAQLAVLTPGPTGFPAASFSTASIASWIATGGGLCSQDAFNSATYTACDDMSAAGNGWCQPAKPLQPSLGVNSGLYFSGGTYLNTCFFMTDMLAGPQFTLGFAFTLDAGFAGATNRQLFDLPGAGGASHQLQVYATSYDIVATFTAGTACTVTSGAVTATAKHTAIIVGDISAGTETLYIDGSSAGSASCTGGLTAFAGPKEIDLGNTIVTTYANPLTGQVLGFTAHNAALSAGQITTLNTYLEGL